MRAAAIFVFFSFRFTAAFDGRILSDRRRSSPNQKQWRTFQHASGATLAHPQSWTTEAMPSGVRLIPPQPSPYEFISVQGIDSNGETDPRSQGVADYLDRTIRQLFPTVNRSIPPTSIPAAQGGTGALYHYHGTLVDGQSFVCDIYVTIQNGVAMSLFAAGPAAQIRRRTSDLEGVFKTMRVGGVGATGGEATQSGPTEIGDDGRLIGMFAGEALAGGGNTGGTYVNTQLVIVLNGDGTAYYGARSYFNGSKRDSAGNVEWTASGSSSGNVYQGRWSAEGGFLTVKWNSGQQTYVTYGFEPDGTLVLRNPKTRKLINFYRRVH